MRTPRTAARVLPISPDGAVLLLQEQDPIHPEAPHWGTIGGAVEPGESLVVGAVRELLEETGLVVDPAQLSGPIAHGVYEFSFDGRDFVSTTTFFAVALSRDVEVSFDNLVPEEVGNVLEARWWLPDELEADGTAVQPDLPDVMRRAVAAVRGATS